MTENVKHDIDVMRDVYMSREQRAAYERIVAMAIQREAAGDGEELAKAERDSLDQRAKGWDAVCDVLFELRPNWPFREGTGIECATAVIREALTTPASAEPEKIEPTPNWCRTCGKLWSDATARLFCRDEIHGTARATTGANGNG